MGRPKPTATVHLTFTSVLALILVLCLAMAGCSSDASESPTPSSGAPGEGSGGGGDQPADNLVAVLNSLPVFPEARLADGQLVDGNYIVSGSVDYLGTGFYVSPGTTTADDVMSFFAKELPPTGWQQELAPWTESAEHDCVLYVNTVISTFLNAGNGLRLKISIPLIHKDAPVGVTNVNLTLATKEVKLFGGPVEEGDKNITPFDTEPAPPVQPGDSDTPTETAPPIQPCPTFETFGIGTPTAAP